MTYVLILVKLIKTGMKDFKKMRDYFRWMNIYVIPETYLAMLAVVEECVKISELSLFTNNYGKKRITLEEFEAIQTHSYMNVIKFLRGEWSDQIICRIRLHLGDIGKGWFNINQSRYEIYEVAKLIRLMELMKHRMQYSLRILVENSISAYIKLLETPCIPCLDVEDDYAWGDNLKESPFISPVAAIFTLHMKLNENGAFYSTDPNLFKPILLKVYDNSLTLTHQIRQIHPFLLSNLKFPSDLYLSSVGLLSEEVCSVRVRFLEAYERAVIPLLAYARQYHIFLELYALNVDEYIAQYKEEQRTAGEYKETIAHHYKMKENLETTLPTSIIIGPFFLVIDQLRTFLISKRQEIYSKLLKVYADRMRELILSVLEEYKRIVQKLSVRPESIEHIFDIRDWMETIPMLVRTQDELARRYLLEYEVLDYFWYSLSWEDFTNKWEAIGWPYKIEQEVKLTEDFHKTEEERFYKIQLEDEFALQDKIEGLVEQVVQMAKQRDYERIHEIAVEMRRVWKTMKEAQEQGQLLNKRQKLFNTPVVPFDSLTKLIKEFEPYKTLWITGSDWLRSYEIWMDNPLGIVDADVIDRMVTDMYKTMVKSIRVFADIEAVQTVAIEIKNQIENFKPLIPLIQSLKNPGMRERHWQKFRDATGINMVMSPTLTFKECLKMNIGEHRDAIIEVADSAGKEYTIESALDKMKAEWENCNMELAPYKDTGTYIMKIPEEIQQMLDDHLVMTQQISFSPFKGPFEDDIQAWGDDLKVMSDVIEEWMEVQK